MKGRVTTIDVIAFRYACFESSIIFMIQLGFRTLSTGQILIIRDGYIDKIFAGAQLDSYG